MNQSPQNGLRLSSKPLLKLIGKIFSVLLLAGILFLGVAAIIAARSDIADHDKLIETGMQAQGIATGKYFEYKTSGTRGSTHSYYKAYYRFTKADGTSSSVIGDKKYGSTDQIKEGMKATVHYTDDPSAKTATTNEQ